MFVICHCLPEFNDFSYLDVWNWLWQINPGLHSSCVVVPATSSYYITMTMNRLGIQLLLSVRQTRFFFIFSEAKTFSISKNLKSVTQCR